MTFLGRALISRFNAASILLYVDVVSPLQAETVDSVDYVVDHPAPKIKH